MKKKLETKLRFVTGFVCTLITFWSCTNDINDLGKNLLPVGDLIGVGELVEKDMKAYTVTDEKQRTDEHPNNLLGTFNDSIFGKTTIDYATQLRLTSFPKFKANDIIDSLVYYVAYQEIYGDTVNPQKFKVYELATDLVYKDKYYQDVDLKGLAKSQVLAQMDYIPRYKDTLKSSGSTERVIVEQQIAFHLDHSLARKLMSADSLTLSDNDLFIKYFKGLYVEAGDVDQGGTILKLTRSAMFLYFRKENDTTKYAQGFHVTDNAARVTRYAHNYSQTAFAANLDKQDNQDSLIYLQTPGGLRAKIFIPDISSWAKLIPALANSKDTVNLTLNKAELIFQVDTTITDVTRYIPQSQLHLAAIRKPTTSQPDSIYNVSDYAFSPEYFGGVYNSKDKTYRFNIAKHVQDIIERKAGKENLGFYLESYIKNSVFRRVVLKGATSKTGIRLEITYSIIK